MANGSRSHISDAELGKQLLKKQLADLNKNPVEGFSAGLINDSDFFKWEVRVLTLLHDSLVIILYGIAYTSLYRHLFDFQILIIGPADTLFEGGFFKCHLIFPKEYPQRPPKMKVISDIWHPNIEKNGDVCISILHEPGNKLKNTIIKLIE